MKFKPDFKSRFRILKGGKISLVVSAMLISGALVVSDANAEVQEISTKIESTFIIGIDDSLNITSEGSIEVVDSHFGTALEIFQGLALENSLTNSGIISATTTNNNDDVIAISTELYNTTVAGTITNIGTISAEATSDNSAATTLSIYSLTGTIENSGHITADTINGDATGINIGSSNGGTITNITNGEIIATSSEYGYATAILINNLSEESEISNSGLIQADSYDATATAIIVNGFEDSTIINSDTGTIEAISESNRATAIRTGYFFNSSILNDGIINAEANYVARGIEVNGTFKYESSITNNNTISVSSINGSVYGIDIDADITNDGADVERNAIINNSEALIEVSTLDNFERAYGINIDNDIIEDLNITNLGTIDVSALGESTAYGIRLEANDVLQNTSITNLGTIKAISGEDSYGILVDLNNYGNSIENFTITNSEDGSIEAKSIIEFTSEDNEIYAYTYVRGIDVQSDLLDSSIKNDGTILVESSVDVTTNVNNGYWNYFDTSLRGILTNELDNSFVENNGTITVNVDAKATHSTENGSFDLEGKARAISVDDLDNGSYVKNTGDISVTVDTEVIGSAYSLETDSEAYGIKVEDIDESSYLLNDTTGIITVTAKASGEDSYSKAVGFLVDGNNGIVTNDGDITVKAEAISNEDDYNYSRADAEAYGMFFESSNYGDINNNGNIFVEATAIGGEYNYSEAYGIKVTKLVDAGKIDNSGDIIVSAESYSVGIYSEYGFEGKYHLWDDETEEDLAQAKIINSGMIDVTSQTGEATGIFSSNMKYATIENQEGGTISVSSDTQNNYAYGIYVDEVVKYTAPENSSIINAGDILVNSADSGTGIYIRSADGLDINNSGNIEVNTIEESIGIKIGSASNTTITNSGTIKATIDGEYNAYGFSIYHDNFEPPHESGAATVINNTSTGKLYGNIYTDPDTTINNAGLISLPSNATAYIGTLNNTGTLEIGLQTKGSLENTSYSQLVTKNATFENNSKINVNVSDNSQNVGLLAGNRLENVVTAIDSLTINGTLNVTDNSALLKFAYVTSDDWTNGEDGAIHLDIAKASENNIVDSTVSGGGNKNSQSAAKTLQTIQDGGNYPAMNPVFEALNQLPSNEAVAKAVETTTPIATNATVGATTQISNGIAGIVTQRQNANMGTGANSGDMMFSEKNFWFKPYGSFGSQNDKDGINGFDLKAGGFGIGLDGEYKDNQNIGFGLFYTNANVDVNNVSQEANLDVFTTLVYGNIPVIDDKTNFLYQAGYSWQKTDTDRKVFTGETATSDYTSKTASLDLKLMRDVQINDNLLLQPMVEVTYRHFTNPAYKENGAGALNLNVDKFTSQELITGVGAIAHYKLNEDSKIIGNLNVGYDMKNDGQTVTSSYQGATGVKFDTDGIDNGRWSYQAGIGYEKEINKTNSINVSYDYQGQGSDFSNNTISAKYVLKF